MNNKIVFMKNNVFKIFGLMLLISILTIGCKKDYEASKITYLPSIETNGDAIVLLHCGDTYEDVGATATANGETLEYTTSITGLYRGGTTLDTDVPDVYHIEYTAYNEDGFSASSSRTVIVACTGDLVNSIEGLYTSTVSRGGVLTAQYTNLKYILIWKESATTYGISDAGGGYYDIGRAYGPNYAAVGSIITANDISSNSFTATTATFPGFGNILDLIGISVDANAKKITYTGQGDFTNSTFGITLTQVNF